MEINKNIAVWRGNSAPPTQYHLWQKGDALLHYNGTEWVLIGNIKAEELSGTIAKSEASFVHLSFDDAVDAIEEVAPIKNNVKETFVNATADNGDNAVGGNLSYQGVTQAERLIPGTPGILSEVSPISPFISMNSVGLTP